MSKRTRGTLLVVLGLVLLAAASLLHLLNQRQDDMAGQNSSILLSGLERELNLNLNQPPAEQAAAPTKHPDEATVPSSPSGEATQPSTPVAEEETEPAPMPETTYSGYSMVGILSVPSINLRLPILSTWSYDLLNVAPCRYSGSVEGGDLILLGHNYRAHFKYLAQVQVGAQVEFAAVDGTVYRYTVDAVDTIRDTEVEKLASDHELNIFTCTLDRVHRTVVRCSQIR